MANPVGFLIDSLYPRRCRSCGGVMDSKHGFFCTQCASDLSPSQIPVLHRLRHAVPGRRRRRPPLLRLSLPQDLLSLGKVRGGVQGHAEGRRPSLQVQWVSRPCTNSLGRLQRTRRGNSSRTRMSRLRCLCTGGGWPNAGSTSRCSWRSTRRKVSRFPLSLDGFVRTRYTRPQVDLDPAEREENVKGAFAVERPEEFKGKRVLLLDDVYTTGATVRECAKVLQKAGAESVYVLTVARAV